MADTETFTPDLSAFAGVLGGDQELEKKELSEMKKKRKKETGAGKKKRTQVDMEPETFDLSNKDVNQRKFKKKMKKHQEHSENYQKLRQRDPFPGDAPVPKESIEKYKRGERMDTDTLRTGFHKQQYQKREKKVSNVAKQTARTEILLTEDAGFIEADEGEYTVDIHQREIAKAVDITSAQKYFELKLDRFGPYRCNYTRNGRFMLTGGAKGHVAAFDWQTKKLMCEINVMERINDVKWLHIETMFAVAQKEWTYVYDNQGIELHCLKALSQVLRMEFLPYHFLLATGNARGYLSYLDVSVGKKVAGYTTGLGRLDVMCQNPRNAVITMGHSGGTVTMWSPNVKEPLVKMLCHGGGTRAVAVDSTGQYMATSGVDRKLKVWDLRTYRELHSYRASAGAGHLSFSQRGLLAASMGNIVEVYKGALTSTVTEPYLSHRLPSSINNLQFCPYEDVLGVGHGTGFTSMLVPGAGEPNFDALEANPYQSKRQRQQAEVKMLLEKIQPDMISMDTGVLGVMDRKTLLEKMEEKKKLAFLKPQKIDFAPKYKKKGRSKAGNVEKRKQKVHTDQNRDLIRDAIQHKAEGGLQGDTQPASQDERRPKGVLDRFKK